MPLQPQDLRGMFVRDRDGAPVGTVEDLYVDRPTGEIRYIGISAEALGVHVLVPLDGVTADEDELGEAVRVPYTRAHLMEAPPLAPGTEPTVALEGEIHSHFERTPYWDIVRARQTTPAPTPEVAARRGRRRRGRGVRRDGLRRAPHRPRRPPDRARPHHAHRRRRGGGRPRPGPRPGRGEGQALGHLRHALGTVGR